MSKYKLISLIMSSLFPKIPSYVDKNYVIGENFDVMKRNILGTDKVMNLIEFTYYLNEIQLTENVSLQIRSSYTIPQTNT